MNPEHKAPQNLSRQMDALCGFLFLALLLFAYLCS